MALNPFNRDTAYFQSMRDRGMMMNAEDLDFQFNNLVEYLNKKIIPLIDRLEANEIPGVDDVNLTNFFLLNIGDGSTKWTAINTNYLNNFSIPLSKIQGDIRNIGSVIATDNSNSFSAATPLFEEEVLISRKNNRPIWRKIESGDIENQSITGDKIGLMSIGIEHLDPTLLGTNLTPNSIITNFILNNNITGTKLADNSIVESKINRNLIHERQYKIYNNTPDNLTFSLLDNSLENRHFSDGVIRGLDATGYSSIQERLNVNIDDDQYYTFTHENIINNSLTYYMFRIAVNVASPANRIFNDGAIEVKHIRNYSVWLGNRTSGKISKTKLSPRIRQKLGI